jgi:hypothetical protein
VQKEELLHLHMLLVHVKKYFHDITGQEMCTDCYNSLNISPVHIHKNKIFHKKAILTIGEEIVQELHRFDMPVMEYASESKREKIAVEQ